MNDEIKREALFYPNLKIEIKTVKDNSKEQIEDIEEFISSKSHYPCSGKGLQRRYSCSIGGQKNCL